MGYVKKPWLSALLFNFGLLDPRAALVAIPLLLWYNRQKIRQFIVATIAFVLATNLPFFFYHDIGLTFLRMGMSTNIISQSYAYDWIPIYGVATLTIIEIIPIIIKKLKSTAKKENKFLSKLKREKPKQKGKEFTSDNKNGYFPR